MADENQNERRDYAKFNGVNFPQWKFGIMLKLRGKKLDQFVLGLEDIPAEVIQCDNMHTYVVDQHTRALVEPIAHINSWTSPRNCERLFINRNYTREVYRQPNFHLIMELRCNSESNWVQYFVEVT